MTHRYPGFCPGGLEAPLPVKLGSLGVPCPPPASTQHPGLGLEVSRSVGWLLPGIRLVVGKGDVGRGGRHMAMLWVVAGVSARCRTSELCGPRGLLTTEAQHHLCVGLRAQRTPLNKPSARALWGDRSWALGGRVASSLPAWEQHVQGALRRPGQTLAMGEGRAAARMPVPWAGLGSPPSLWGALGCQGLVPGVWISLSSRVGDTGPAVSCLKLRVAGGSPFELGAGGLTFRLAQPGRGEGCRLHEVGPRPRGSTRSKGSRVRAVAVPGPGRVCP